MDNEADMVILFVSHENESFTLLNFGQILICQKFKAANSNLHGLQSSQVQSTKIKCNSSVMDIWHEIPWQPF